MKQSHAETSPSQFMPRPAPKDAWIEVLSGENEFDRTFRAGVLRAAREEGFGRTCLSTEDDFREDFGSPAFRRNAVAVIGAVRDQGLLRDLARHGVPCILTGMREGAASSPARNRVVCSTDNLAVGRMAGEYFLGLGRFRSFAFFGGRGNNESQNWWINRREKGFTASLAAAGKFNVGRFGSLPASLGADEMARTFAAWAAAFPKPLAVFAANDIFARDAAMLCELAGLHVPDEVAILGADNDRVLCESAATPLSSIALETERLGREAFALALRMLRGEMLRGRIALCPPSHVAERKSSSDAPLQDLFAAKAVDFISAHAREPVSVADVVAACGTSRRFLEKRVKSLTGRTLLETIHEKRLGAVVERLRDTDEPIGVISDALGFSCQASLCTIFRRRFGCSPREFRADPGTVQIEQSP